MHIPEKVKIGYKDYTVNCVNELGDLYGQVLYDTQVVNISNKYTQDQMNCAFVHEIIHALDNMNSIDLSEKQVITLGIAIYQFIKQNEDILWTIT